MQYVLITALSLCLSLPFPVLSAASAESSQEALKQAPPFELPDINGKKVGLSDFKGKVVLINFWATWCTQCKAEMPSLNNLYAALKNEGFVVLAVASDPTEKPVQKFVAEKAITFPVLMDKDKEVSFDNYAVFAMPTSVLVDRKGMIIEKFFGEQVWDAPDIKDKIARVLRRK